MPYCGSERYGWPWSSLASGSRLTTNSNKCCEGADGRMLCPSVGTSGKSPRQSSRRGQATASQSTPTIFPELFDGPPDRIAIVSGIHGNGVNGTASCACWIRHLQANPDRLLPGKKIRIIPVTNSLGLDMSRRAWPIHNVDIHDQFLWATHALRDGLTGRDISSEDSDRGIEAGVRVSRVYCVDIHSSNSYMTEAPQVRVLLDG